LGLILSDHPQRVFDGLYHCTKFGNNKNSSFENMEVLVFGANGWKTPIYTLRIGVLWLFDHLNGVQHKRNPQKHIPEGNRIV